jgi:hypothetical protein
MMPSKFEAWISIVAISLMVSPAELWRSGPVNAQVASIEWTSEPSAKFRATQEQTTEVTLDNFRTLLIKEGQFIKSELQVGNLACEVRGDNTQACLMELRLETTGCNVVLLSEGTSRKVSTALLLVPHPATGEGRKGAKLAILYYIVTSRLLRVFNPELSEPEFEKALFVLLNDGQTRVRNQTYARKRDASFLILLVTVSD